MNGIKNRIQLVGHLGAAPAIYTFDNGTNKATLSLATNETYTNRSGEKVEETHWHTVVAFGKMAETMERLLDKGSQVMVEGRLTNRSWETDEGEKRYVTEVIVNEFLLLSKKAA